MGDDIKNSNKEFKSALHYEVIKFNYEFKWTDIGKILS